MSPSAATAPNTRRKTPTIPAVLAERAAIYTRISKWDGIGESLGVQRQQADCRTEAGRRGWPVLDVYSDDDKSAYGDKIRPGYVRLCDDLKAGVIDAVIVWDVDRLHRSPRELEDFVTLIEATGAVVVSVSGGDYDLETADGRFKARIMGAVARKESEDKSRRLRRKHEEIVGKGRPNGGRRPLGYHNDRVTPATPESFPCSHPLADKCNARPGEDEIVREVIGRVAAGETLTRISDDLNTRGVVTSTGGPFTLTNVRRIALNGRYAGRRFHNGVDVGAADWPALVDEATWLRAGALLNAPDRAKRRSARRYLLAGGLAVCGRCGQRLYSKPGHSPSGPVPLYVCRSKREGGCGGVTIRADFLEQLVADAVIAAVESPSFAQALQSQQGGDRKAAAAVKKINTELDDLEHAKESGAIDLREYMRFRDAARGRLVEAQSRMASDTTGAAVGRYAGQTGSLRAKWDDPATTLDVKQAIVRATIKPVVVAHVGKASGGRFNPDRVTIERAI